MNGSHHDKAKNLYFTFTMDCERLDHEAPGSGGPKDWGVSERAILGMAEVLREKKVKGGFYPMPEVAKYHRHIFWELAKEGFELGLQFHSTCFRDFRYDKHLGFYNYEDQKQILTLAKSDWADALGRSPTTFRCGNTSANDYTYPILFELGYRQSSSAKPGRYRKGVHALWHGVYPYPHHVSPMSRLICGDLDLYEIPTSCHPTKRRYHDPNDPIDLRPDTGRVAYPEEIYAETIDACIEEMIKMDQPIKAIVAPTHNTQEYLDRNNPKRKLMEFVIDYTKEAAEKHSLKFIPATLEEIHQQADEVGAF